MSQITSGVDICNLALDHLKEAPITSIENPTTPTESLCSRWYDHTRKVVLRKHVWNFAIKRVKLAKLSEAPAFEYSSQFQLPNDFVRLISIGEHTPQKNYQLEDNKILVNELVSLTSDDSLPLKYIYDYQQVSKMDALFIDILSIELAIRLSYSITGSKSKGESLFTILKDLAPEAYAIDGQERPPIRKQQSHFKNKRRGFGSRYASPYTNTDGY